MSNLEELIKADDFNGVRELLDSDPGAILEPMSDAPSPILLAVYWGKREIANLLRERKQDLDIQEAAAMGDQHELERLIEHQEDINAYSRDGFFPLGYACFFGHPSAAALLLERGAAIDQVSKNPLGVASLHAALANGHKEIALDLIRRGADVDAIQGGESWTALHYCAYSGDRETAEALLDRGAKTDHLDNQGRTPADLADERGFAELAEALRPKGA